ncbi:MAG TPA: DUF4360 domain-containing protein [Pilimelia sp.]|nr:DUF4360 domain-containing protein [Pilimelia sp.]
MAISVNRLLGGALAAAGIAASVAVPAHAAPPANAAPPRLVLAGYGGSGCPVSAPDDTNVIINPEGTGFTATYGRFEARGNGGEAPVQKACSLNFKVTLSPGQQLGVRRVQYLGEAVLNRTGRATFAAKYFWQGASRTEALPGWSHRGEFSDSWQANHRLTEFWGSRCGGQDQFVVTQNLAVHGSDKNMVTVDTADADYSTIWELETRPCR